MVVDVEMADDSIVFRLVGEMEPNVVVNYGMAD